MPFKLGSATRTTGMLELVLASGKVRNVRTAEILRAVRERNGVHNIDKRSKTGIHTADGVEPTYLLKHK